MAAVIKTENSNEDPVIQLKLETAWLVGNLINVPEQAESGGSGSESFDLEGSSSVPRTQTQAQRRARLAWNSWSQAFWCHTLVSILIKPSLATVALLDSCLVWRKKLTILLDSCLKWNRYWQSCLILAWRYFDNLILDWTYLDRFYKI